MTLHTTRCHQRYEVFLGIRIWHHLCVAQDQSSTLYYNGAVITSSSLCTAAQGDEDFFVEQFIVGGSLWGGMPFSGFLADVRLFDAALTENVVQAVTENLPAAVPVFEVTESSLQSLSGVLTDVKFGAVDVKSLASTPNEEYYFYIETKVSYNDGRALCKNIGGSLATVTESNTLHIMNILLKYSDKAEAEMMDMWIHVPDSSLNKTLSTCPLMHVYLDPPALLKEEGECEIATAVLCHLSQKHRLRLLGLEKEITLYPTDDNVFEDGSNYRLTASPVSLQMVNVQSGSILYERSLSSSKQLTGRYKWSVTENVAKSNSSNTEVSLTLTACGKGQFTCSSGDCVHLKVVCDLVNDCEDASDEVPCSNRTVLPNTYNKLFSPSQGTLSHTAVSLQVTFEQVNHMQLTENLLRLMLRINVKWRDPRIVFKYLQQNYSVVLTEEVVKEMWLPSVDLVTASQDSKDKIDFPNNKDKKVTATARTNGSDTVLGDAEGECVVCCVSSVHF